MRFWSLSHPHADLKRKSIKDSILIAVNEKWRLKRLFNFEIIEEADGLEVTRN